MKRLITLSLATLALTLAGSQARAEEECAGYGTSVNFYDNPTKAAEAAAKEQKLVMVLHVSGNFEDPRFT